MSNNMMEIFIKHLINQLQDAGIEDVTADVIGYKDQNKNIKIQLYTQEQWDAKLKDKSKAVKLMSQYSLAHKPDYVITHKEQVYLVELLK